ncbi:hypothetical protein MA16_Dca022867 [Dendrobium catenatum]|uniref:Uncharacterized protein n=1 Tax=Dendrobium catenatum TaxID=906689 RepID=A0A2I0XI41_9ASPA|nr:hypothetical protein MA16_Dca022867 [Dendrobium catenatum]
MPILLSRCSTAYFWFTIQRLNGANDGLYTTAFNSVGDDLNFKSVGRDEIIDAKVLLY